MSHHHGYLSFVGGRHLARTLTGALAFSGTWQDALTRHNSSVYAAPPSPQVAAAFVLQHLLSIPAQLSAFAALTGPWQVSLGTLEEPGISCDLAPALYPARLGFLSVSWASAKAEERLDSARNAYRTVGFKLADAYTTPVRMSSRQRLGMVDDLWEMSVREARAATGGGLTPPVQRRSCCFIYALPGCHECAGCPRTPTAS